jgi:hydrogenase maturation protease
VTGVVDGPGAARTLVAGVGNIFREDDGFGPEVARCLAAEALPPCVRVIDYGIRSTHLAYDLLDGWDRLILIDLVRPEGHPGSLHLLEVSPDDATGGDAGLDPHGFDPGTVLAGVGMLGGTLPPTVVVGCEPATVEDGIGLSPPVEAAVPEAVRAVRSLLSGQMPLASGRRAMITIDDRGGR